MGWFLRDSGGNQPGEVTSSRGGKILWVHTRKRGFCLIRADALIKEAKGRAGAKNKSMLSFPVTDPFMVSSTVASS